MKKPLHMVRIKEVTWDMIQKEIATKHWLTPTSFVHEAVTAYLNGEIQQPAKPTTENKKNNNNKKEIEIEEKVKVVKLKDIPKYLGNRHEAYDLAFFYYDIAEDSQRWVTRQEEEELYDVILHVIICLKGTSDMGVLQEYLNAGCARYAQDIDTFLYERGPNLSVPAGALKRTAKFVTLYQNTFHPVVAKVRDPDPDGVIARKRAERQKELEDLMNRSSDDE